MHRSRSNSKISQDLNLRLGPSSPLNGEMFASNCARVFPDLITIEDDDDVEIFSQRPFVEELRLFPCPSLSVPILLEEDLELRLGPKAGLLGIRVTKEIYLMMEQKTLHGQRIASRIRSSSNHQAATVFCRKR
ncbi:uncharacterized protein LOC131246593 isoform X5 [Magnolia sinica]|uniref:uncharacterized protein LOC131246593 isoform X5 n=1 Tax=Magnolia sinica TaxID=86752 RepID=UPI002659EC20|nr:uncharacterized protein LOC131246593 isoform X5 [Magnolia sinica]